MLILRIGWSRCAALMTVSNYRLVSMSLNAFGVQILPTDERLPEIR